MPTMRVVALDPGRTTGYAHGLITDGKMLVVTGQAKWSQIGLWSHLLEAEPDILICERFEYRNRARKGLDMYPRELIGIVELFCQQKELKLYLQMPATVMTYFDDKRLKEHHLYKPGKEHSNDAVRHLLYWYTFGSGYKYNERGFSAGA